jgi:hypothetical protein
MGYRALEKYDAIIINPDMATRMRLKQVCASVVNFGRIIPLGSVYEAMQRLKDENETPTQIIFIGHQVGHEQTAAFIKEAKTAKNGQDAAFILVLPTKDQASSDVAQAMMIGADGVLFEPYSVDILVEITVISARVRRERWVGREETAYKLLINDLMAQLDMLAFSKSAKYEVGPALKLFRQATAVIGTLEPESLDIFHRIAVDAFENAQIPQALMQKKKYVGASNRVRKIMSDRMTSEIGKLSGGQKTE